MKEKMLQIISNEIRDMKIKNNKILERYSVKTDFLS